MKQALRIVQIDLFTVGGIPEGDGRLCDGWTWVIKCFFKEGCQEFKECRIEDYWWLTAL